MAWVHAFFAVPNAPGFFAPRSVHASADRSKALSFNDQTNVLESSSTVLFGWYTFPKTNISPWKLTVKKKRCPSKILKWPLFRGVIFQACLQSCEIRCGMISKLFPSLSWWQQLYTEGCATTHYHFHASLSGKHRSKQPIWYWGRDVSNGDVWQACVSENHADSNMDEVYP